MENKNKDPLHGRTLEMILNYLLAHYSWQQLSEEIPINCFKTDPSIKSSLKFLRKTEWARKRVEALFLHITRNGVIEALFEKDERIEPLPDPLQRRRK
ncbi:MAG: VF530 family DNA-binding protein [Flavobacteriales bacterium]